MDAYVWEPDDYLDDPATEWEDPEALPFGLRPRLPRSTALTRRLFAPRPRHDAPAGAHRLAHARDGGRSRA